jgi:uncharacterized Zn-binding protein involved in type VI secretion
MPPAHRQSDRRQCGAGTVVQSQSTVTIGGQLWALEGDQCDHGLGTLRAQNPRTVTIQGRPVIVQGDFSDFDLICLIILILTGFPTVHCWPHPSQGSPIVSCYG